MLSAWSMRGPFSAGSRRRRSRCWPIPCARPRSLEATEAQYRQTVAVYVNQVLIAYGDVEDALTDLHALIDMVGRYGEAVTAARNYRRLASVQYNTGLADYLVVIDAERTLLANQLSRAQAASLQQTASIRLIKALGGGWEDRP